MWLESTGNTTTSAYLPSLQRIFHINQALTVLEKRTIFSMFCKGDEIPLYSGNTARWFRPLNFTTPTVSGSMVTEGTTPSGLTYGERTLDARPSQYADFFTISDRTKYTSRQSFLQDASQRLGYRAALLKDLICRSATDDMAPSMTLTTQGSYLSVRDIRAGATALENADVPGLPDQGGHYGMIFSPLNRYDVVNDPEAGGLLDLSKRREDVSNSAYFKPQQKDGWCFDVAGTRCYVSTNVNNTTTSTYRAVMYGNEAFGDLTLAGKGGNAKMLPGSDRFNIYTDITTTPSLANPTGQIGGFASFNFFFCCIPLDGTPTIGGVARARSWDAVSSIG